MRRRLSRLRWQLTVSHLIAIVVTLVSMIAAIFVLVGSWMAMQTSPRREPANDARIIARSVSPLVDVVDDHDSLNVILRALTRGTVRPQVGPGPFSPEPVHRVEGMGPSLRGLAYVVVVGPDGQVLGSSDPSGAAFAPPERAEWAPLVAAALSGERDTAQLTRLREGPGPLALGAYPIGPLLDGPPWWRGDPTSPLAGDVVAKNDLAEASGAGTVIRGIFFFGAATIVILGASFLFALASAALVGYVLSRQLVRRLERLGGAVEALATGQLDRRVEPGPDDEVGQLARRFNDMADRLTTTVAALDSRTREAESALTAKRELIANVSHELRTPLASISGHAESLLLLGETASPERREESLTVLHREARQLGRLVDDLFLLSTTESGGLRLTIREVNVAEILEEVTASFQPLARRQGHITIVSDVEPDLPLARGDRERIVQVLGNLVRNALRFTSEGGLVSLRAGRQDGGVCVTVEDTGSGIAPDQLERIFERFYRGDDARDRASGGAGLGLAIVRELVEAMGGTVAAESVAGQGSRFSFTLLEARTPTASLQKADADLTRA